MSFYVGQKVVALDTITSVYGDGIIKNDIYVIKNIKDGFCHHAPTIIDIGRKIPVGVTTGCPICCRFPCIDGVWWFASRNFAPLEEIPESHERAVQELLKESLTVPIKNNSAQNQSLSLKDKNNA